jgi:hypothetical protein
VLESDGLEVWRWSDGLSFTQAIREEILASGDTIRVDEAFVWPEGIESAVLSAYLSVTDAPGGFLTQPETAVRQRLFLRADDQETADTMARKSDFDGSGSVDFGDFISFAVVFGTRSGEFSFDSTFDIDGDGQVGFSDFLAFAGAFGTTVPTS